MASGAVQGHEVSEADVRTRLTQVSVLMRRTARERSEVDQRWQALVEERIILQHQLDVFEVYRAETVV